ncbi:MAG: hypothetical protein JNJ73_04895 [Hyphomonadaceae bacterium]|nr:hypothetical protein [Hyphomonadaceae bacterium]
MKKEVLIRFVVQRRDFGSGVRTGIFQAVNFMTPDDAARSGAEDLAAWFDANLRAPFRDPDQQANPDWRIEPERKAISWIKASAIEHVSKLHQLKNVLEEAGWVVEEIRTDRTPGSVVYEDEHQVVAAPYADTPT